MDTLPLPHESDLAEKLGVARPVLIEARIAILTDEDFERKNTGIHYRPSGVEKVCTHLHLDVPACLSAAPKKNGAAVVTLTVVRPARLNRHIVFAATPPVFGPQEKNAAPEIAVRVRDAHAFRAGQELHAVMQTATVARLHGPQPRARGRQRPAR